MPLYCDNCFLAFEGERCPSCGRKKCREAKDDDLCYLTEQNVICSGLLADVLKQNGIEFVERNVLGAGLAFKTGMMSERVRFYVFFSRLGDAETIVEGLFSAADEADEALEDEAAEDGADEDSEDADGFPEI
ncbi:MAG: hypothetical protein J6X47_10475 [Clostridia bacterium]|nr:hypothetical protein [Clostridia bacterium]